MAKHHVSSFPARALSLSGSKGESQPSDVDSTPSVQAWVMWQVSL